MCGIFGRIGESDKIQKLQMLAVCNQDRGSDSFGVYVKKRQKKEGFIMKDTGGIITAIAKNYIKPDWWKSSIFLGHTRAASKGTISRPNAHPFRYGNIVGAHNGCISNFDELRNEWAKEEPKWANELDKMEVDSQLLVWIIARRGLDFLDRLACWAGAWWIDVGNPNSIFVWRNTGTVSFAAEDDCLYFSSDEDHLKACGFEKPWKADDDHLYEIPIDHPENMTKRRLTSKPYYRGVITTYINDNTCNQGMLWSSVEWDRDPKTGQYKRRVEKRSFGNETRVGDQKKDEEEEETGLEKWEGGLHHKHYRSTKDGVTKCFWKVDDAADEYGWGEATAEEKFNSYILTAPALSVIGECPQCNLSIYLKDYQDGHVSCSSCEWEGFWNEMLHSTCKEPDAPEAETATEEHPLVAQEPTSTKEEPVDAVNRTADFE